MSYEKALNEEINRILDDRQTSKLAWDASWIAHAIITSHEDGILDGDDADFWKHCGYRTVRDAVSKFINKRAGKDAENAEQPRFPGFEHLQLYYVVERDGREIGLPVETLTDAEINAKAELYRTMGRACFAHARELERFMTDRATPNTAAA